MTESVKSILPIINQANIRKANGSDIKSDAFEALLAALTGQSLNFPGNISASEVFPIVSAADSAKPADIDTNYLNILYSLQSDADVKNFLSDLENVVQEQLKEGSSLNETSLNQDQSHILKMLSPESIKALAADEKGDKTKIVTDSNIKEDIKQAPLIFKTLINKAFEDIKSNTGFLVNSTKDSSSAAEGSKASENEIAVNKNSKTSENDSEIFDAFTKMPELKNGIKHDNVKSYSVISAKGENIDAIKVQLTSKQINSEESAKPDNKRDALPERQTMYKDGFMQVLNNTNLHEKVHQNALLDTKQIVESNKESILNQIYDKIKVINGKDFSELHVNLKPDGLGEVAIKILMDKGSMIGRIMVDNNNVKELIESSLPQIKENLRNENVNVSNLSVSVGINQDSFLNYNGFSNNERMRQRSSFLRRADKNGFSQTISERNIGVLNLLV